MSITLAPNFTQRNYSWTNWKVVQLAKVGLHQYDDDGVVYTIYFYDEPEVHICQIFKGTVPDSILLTSSITQVQNDLDKADFEANYKPGSNEPLEKGNFTDPRIIPRFGNLTALSTSEVLVSNRPYAEPASQAQRSVVSTSASDANPSGVGAKQVRITYLDSNYVLKTEDVFLNGLTAVNTVATDIRFIEKFQVIKGAAAVGAIRLMTTTAGGGTEICGISIATEDAFMCHHYVPAGKVAYILGWGSVVDNNCKLKLKTQARYNTNLVDLNADLYNLTGISVAPADLNFYRDFKSMKLEEKIYVRVTAVPSQASSTIIRSYLDIWET